MAFIENKDDDIIAEINVTPLVDIMLVLLIIFMLVSTVVDYTAIDIKLPHAATGTEIKNETISIVIAPPETFFLAGKQMNSIDELFEKLKVSKNKNPELQVMISADRKVYHESVIRVIDLVRNLGINRFAIHVDPLDDSLTK